MEKSWVVDSRPGMELVAAEQLLQVIVPMGSFSLDDIRTSVTEACLNAMEHGNRWDPEKKVCIKLRVNEDDIVIRIGDQGEGFRWEQQRRAEDIWEQDNPRGWGLHFIIELADRVEIHRGQDGFYMDMHFKRGGS